MRLTLLALLASLLPAAEPRLPVPAPKGAVMLFDGRSLDGWDIDSHWKIVNGELLIDASVPHPRCRIHTKDNFDDVQLHLEYWLPLMADKTGQARANSGIFLQGRYEVQILDTYGHPPEIDGAGSLYKIAPPMVNASFAPERWQSYDITYHGARFNGDEVVARPRITVIQNGVKIHDNVELQAFNTPNAKETSYARTGPIVLQNHRCPVKFRNIWVVKAAR
ncbi:MAG TPA: DUF1080 domain-containing protein [Bryobacteraceae bacterium]|jgi:3-keto-disaccharide hydrolase|nr:DUF1080 domain-containing protein [Bryobacteraceae bacterium]